MTLRRIAAVWVALVLHLAGPAFAVTPEEEARLKALEDEREALVEQVFQERLTRVLPETFHRRPGISVDTTLSAVQELLLLEWLDAALEHGGTENIDRVRTSVNVLRKRTMRDAARTREILGRHVRPERDDRFEAERAEARLLDVVANPLDPAADPARGGAKPVQPQPAAPGHQGAEAAAEVVAEAPKLDYIPVAPEELQRLRERHMVDGFAAPDDQWYAQLRHDPREQERWAAAARAENEKLKRTTARMDVKKGASYSLGVWIQDAWVQKNPFRLGIIAIFLLGFFAVGYVLFIFLRKQD